MKKIWNFLKRIVLTIVKSFKAKWTKKDKAAIITGLAVTGLVIAASFTQPLFVLAEIVTIAVITYHFTSQIPDDTPMRGLVTVLVSLAATVSGTWLFWFAREVAFALMLIAMPGLFKEAGSRFKETRDWFLHHFDKEPELAEELS